MDQSQPTQSVSPLVPTPSFPPSEQNPVVIHHKHRPILGSALLILALALSILAGKLLFANHWPDTDEPVVAIATPTLSASTSPVTEIPADWKTYTNTEYGFEFRYPVNYSSSQTGQTTWAPRIESDYARIQINKNENLNQPNYDAYWQTHPGSTVLAISNLEVIERPVGKSLDGESEYQFDFMSQGYSVLFFTKSTATQGQLSEFKKILSTFKFTSRPVASNVFEVAKINIGDMVGAMTVSRITPTQLTVDFSGTVTVIGELKINNSEMGPRYSISNLTEESLRKMPVMKGDGRFVWFAINNPEKIISAGFKNGDIIELTINAYHFVYLESAVWNTADMVDIRARE